MKQFPQTDDSPRSFIFALLQKPESRPETWINSTEKRDVDLHSPHSILPMKREPVEKEKEKVVFGHRKITNLKVIKY